ncbi:MAG: hypothetical protein KF684_03940 [Phycisphaeraceae bacterium]|nr:hypothetical protein [Phycisphaeraceae bacterium]
MTRKRRGRARVVASVALAVVGAAALALGLIAQWSSAPTPVWARLVDGSMSFLARPDRAGPLAYMNLQIDPRPPDDQPRFVYVPGAGVVTWTPGGPTRVGMGSGAVYALREHGLDKVLLLRAPAWVVWGSGGALFVVGGAGLLARGRRVRRGACVSCGYDLSGLRDGASCPECGGERTTPA